MPKGLTRRAAVLLYFIPPYALSFVFSGAGREYGVGVVKRLTLCARVFRNSCHRASASSFLEQLAVVRAILATPLDVEGDVAEFGCYKGLSSASLSLACALTQRRLVVFDSFAGLPDPGAQTVRQISGGQEVGYSKGDYAGTLDEVRANIANYGALSVCEFVPGYYESTLPGRPDKERFALIFEDADLPSSVKDVLRWAWPKLVDGGPLYTHEARDREVMQIFFDEPFWVGEMQSHAPGVIGAGTGLAFSPTGSCLAYVVKSAADAT